MMKLNEDKFCGILKKHAPVKSRRVKHRRRPYWLTGEMTTAQNLRDFYHRIKDWEKYKHWRNKTKSLIRASKANPFKDAIDENKPCQYLWQHVNHITGEGTSKNNLTKEL